MTAGEAPSATIDAGMVREHAPEVVQRLGALLKAVAEQMKSGREVSREVRLAFGHGVQTVMKLQHFPAAEQQKESASGG